MTDKRKIAHTIEVLKTLVDRSEDLRNLEAETVRVLNPVVQNLTDLVTLLEKPHETDSQKQKAKTSHASEELAERLWNLIKTRKSNTRQPDMARWSIDMDKILRIDGRTSMQVEELIDWSQQHNFWQYNILSPSKLRKQLDRLEMTMSRDHQWKARRSLRRPEGKSAKEKYMDSLEAKDE